MARVTGPLHSDDARNSFAGSMVFSGWKGAKTVRQLVTPINRETEGQGNVRMALGGTGRAAKAISPDSNVATALKTITVGVNSYVSNFVKFVMKNYFADPIATTYEAIYTAYDEHTAQSSFDTNAATLGLTTVNIAYKGVTNPYSGGMQLYVLAKYLCDIQGSNPDLLASDPFDTALASWTGSEITAMLAELAPQA
jgi:hypothetical protein